jgi:CMP-N-acetylneuraminic acid synthetase
MKILAIIPARGGSKGIPRKNVRPLAGKPLIAHTIGSAKGSSYVDRIAVSTDDQEIADVARKYGAEVIWRPAEISGDKASSESALLHALEHLEMTERYTPDLLVFLQCTAPLTASDDIDGTIRAFLEEKADSAFAVVASHYFLWVRDEHGEAQGLNHDKRVRQLRQERDPQFIETGAVYVLNAAKFRDAKHRFFGKTVMHEIPPERSWDIDEPVDWEIVEVLLARRSRDV